MSVTTHYTRCFDVAVSPPTGSFLPKREFETDPNKYCAIYYICITGVMLEMDPVEICTRGPFSDLST